MNSIHPLAYIGSDVTIGKDVRIDPYAVIQGSCHIGDHAHISAHSRIADTDIGAETIVTPFAKIEKSQIGPRCKVGCELRKCTLGERVQASHTNITLENTHISGYTNIGAGTVFGIWGGTYTGPGAYIKSRLEIGSRVFVGLGTSCIPRTGETMRIGDNVFIAANTLLRHDVPDNCTVYPASLADRITHPIIKRTDSYIIIQRNKMQEDNIMKWR